MENSKYWNADHGKCYSKWWKDTFGWSKSCCKKNFNLIVNLLQGIRYRKITSMWGKCVLSTLFLPFFFSLSLSSQIKRNCEKASIIRSAFQQQFYMNENINMHSWILRKSNTNHSLMRKCDGKIRFMRFCCLFIRCFEHHLKFSHSLTFIHLLINSIQMIFASN